MRKIFGFILGAFTGGLLGAAAALLLTPVTGNELARPGNQPCSHDAKRIN